MSKNAILVYTAEGHPTALRCTRFRKKFGLQLFHRNLANWNPGRPAETRKTGSHDPGSPAETEDCKMVVVENGESDVAKAYEAAGIPVRVLKPRRVEGTPITIDIDATEKEQVRGDEYLSKNKPASAKGKKWRNDAKKKQKQIV